MKSHQTLPNTLGAKLVQLRVAYPQNSKSRLTLQSLLLSGLSHLGRPQSGALLSAGLAIEQARMPPLQKISERWNCAKTVKGAYLSRLVEYRGPNNGQICL